MSRLPGETPPILWFGALREPSGYADEARAYLLALEAAGRSPIAREPSWCIGDAGLSGAQREAVEKAVARPVPSDGGFVAIHHFVPGPSQPNCAGVPNVMRTMFETDGLPTRFKARLMEVDEVWVPTEFNVDTFARGGVPRDRLRVLPETLDFDLFTPGTVDPLPVADKRAFTFLTNFDFTDRKGWDVLLDAWVKAFDPDDDVCLLLKCVSQHGTSRSGIERRIEAHLDGRPTAPIIFNTDVLPISAMPRLYAAADAYVMASRGEGWGRPYMEAMAMGLPTIGSNWSGNLEFMSDANSWLVDGKMIDVPDDAQAHTPLYRGHRWFDPDVDALALAMRAVAKGGEATRTKASSARGDLIERFGIEPIADRIGELAADLQDRWKLRSQVSFACAWRGDFGAGHSLAVVNDGIVDLLEQDEHAVRRLSPESLPTRLEVPGVAAHWPPQFVAPSLGPFVLYQPWEFGRIPEAWVESIRSLVDEVWVPSNSVREAYVASGVARELVRVVPNGVDLDRFTPEGATWPLPPSAKTTFLFVGGTIHRKGIDVLLQAYARAFVAADDVRLVLKGFGAGSHYRGMTAESMIAAFDSLPNSPELVFLDEEVPFDRLPSLYRAADVLVQPYRGEGFCLPALEALACGVPVIVTDGGPTDDFTSEECAWRIPARQVPMASDSLEEQGYGLAPGGYLLEPDADALIEILRAATEPATRASRAAHARAHAERFGWQSAADHAVSRIQALHGRIPVRDAKPADVPDRRGTLFYIPADWDSARTWVPGLHAYLDAFTQDDDVTLVLPAADLARVTELVSAEIERSSSESIADIALADPAELGLVALELAADAAICCEGTSAPRARRVLPPDAGVLRTALPRVTVAA
jgi:glycosyltransferase involved in cell wall biosynthesis